MPSSELPEQRLAPQSLAIEGGPKVIAEGPPVWPKPDGDVLVALEAAFRDGSWGRYQGLYTENLRNLLAQHHHIEHAWLCSSGTIAVELALRSLRVGSGDEVILSAYDFPGNFRAIEAVGARPVLVDLAPGCWHMDEGQVDAARSPDVKALIVSHLHGSLAAMPALREIADRHGLALVEDACQVPGAIVQGKMAGSWGDVGVLSFGGSKLLTAGRGGAIVTNREDVIQRLKVITYRGNDAYPLSELQAAVLIPQIAKLASANAVRLANARQLLNRCSELPGLAGLSLKALEEQNAPAFYKLPWLIANANDDCDSPQFEQTRRRFIAAMQAEGVAVDEGFRGFSRRTGSRCRVIGSLDNARRAAAATILLHHPVLLEPSATIERVADAFKKVARRLFASSIAS